MTFSTLARECLGYLTMRGYSPRTLDSYETRWMQFRAFLKVRRGEDDDIRSFTGPMVFAYCTYLGERGASPNTILGHLSALSSLARFAMKAPSKKGSPLLTSDPTKTFDWPTPITPETQYLLPAELKAFLEVAIPPYMALARDLLVETGLRASEAVRANVGDLREVDGRHFLSVTVKGRGARERRLEMPLSAGLAAHIQDRLLREARLDPMAPLIVGEAGQRLTRTGLTNLVYRIAEQAGITRMRVGAHKLRHTANVVARFAGVDALVRSKLLGHSSTKSLERYDHLIPGELQEARDQVSDAMRRYLGIGHATESGDVVPKVARPEEGQSDNLG